MWVSGYLVWVFNEFFYFIKPTHYLRWTLINKRVVDKIIIPTIGKNTYEQNSRRSTHRQNVIKFILYVGSQYKIQSQVQAY